MIEDVGNLFHGFAVVLQPYNIALMVLGTAMQYDIAEVVDPLMHVVAKIRKDVLAQLK